MYNLQEDLKDLFLKAFAKLNISVDDDFISDSDRPDLADYQVNIAFGLAKQLKQNPKVIAQSILDAIEHNQIAEISIAGAGFINIKLNKQYLLLQLIKIAANPNSSIKKIANNKRVMLDYGGPNVAKSMHVGHLRSAIIGEALKRVYRIKGYDVISDVHLGDWGTQMGMVITELARRNPDLPYFDVNKSSDYPTVSPLTIEDLETLYPQASQNCKNNPAYYEEAKQATLDLQHGRQGYVALWQHLVDVSIASIKKNYKALNVEFDLWLGESTVNHLIKASVEKWLSTGIAVQDDGAVVIQVAEDNDNQTVPPLILYKNDGAVLYGTTDLLTIVDRMHKYQPDEIIYIADKRQGLHFTQVFRAANKTNVINGDTVLTFLGYGTMNGTDGKPFKTRDGGVMSLSDLLSTAKDKACARMELDNREHSAELENTTLAIAISAIKFADLQNNINSDYIFDLDKMLNFEGKTGPYLLYQAVRIKSLLTKINSTDNFDIDLTVLEVFWNDTIQKLILQIFAIDKVLDSVITLYAPHILVDYLYKLATSFSSFYANHRIIDCDNLFEQQVYLLLAKLVLSRLAIGLDLLGIDIPQSM